MSESSERKIHPVAFLLALVVWATVGWGGGLIWHSYFGDTYIPHTASKEELQRTFFVLLPVLILWGCSLPWLVGRFERFFRPRR